MRKIVIFRNVALAVLFGAISLTSCVQNDMYDEYFDEDLSSETMIARRKFKNDNGGQSGPSAEDINNAIQWVNTCTTPGGAECFAYALSNYSGKSLPAVRNELGSILYNNAYGWEYTYKMAVTGLGLPMNFNVDGVVKSITGATPYNYSDFINAVKSLIPVESENGEMRASLGFKVIVCTGSHWGVINYLVYKNGSWSVRIIDQASDASPCSIDNIAKLYK